MSSSTSLVAVKTDRSDLIVQGGEWNALKEQCAMLVKSQFLPPGIKTAEQALAIALKGRELGIAPMAAFGMIHVIQGKPCISAELMLALIFRNLPGAKIEIERYEADGCTLVATRPGHRAVKFTFDAKDAKAAELLGKDNWRKYPRAMYRSRTISEMARSVFPDAIMGCSYTPEELGANTDGNGEVIEAVVVPPKVTKAAEPSPADGVFDAPKAESDYTPPPPPAKPAPKKGSGYDGSDAHAKALEKQLIAMKVDASAWKDIADKMLGKSFNQLDNIVKEVRGS